METKMRTRGRHYRFGMLDCKPNVTPMESNLKKLQAVSPDSELIDCKSYRKLIGSLMYLVNTRPDICFSVNTLSQFMSEPRKYHFIAAKHILRYVRGTIQYGLSFYCSNDLQLHGFLDTDWAGCIVDRKSTSGFCFSLGLAMIAWYSKKQKCVAQSIAKAEYVAACSATREAIGFENS